MSKPISRRDFVKLTAVASAAVGNLALPKIARANTKDTIRTSY